MSELSAISRNFRDEMLKIDWGTGPDKLLIVSISLSKKGMLLRLSGMLPTKLFTASDKRVREERLPSEAGISPVRLFWAKLSILIDATVAVTGGMDPTKLLLWR